MDQLAGIKDALNNKQAHRAWSRQLLENLAASKRQLMACTFEERKKGKGTFIVPAECVELTEKHAIFEFSDRSRLSVAASQVEF